MLHRLNPRGGLLLVWALLITVVASARALEVSGNISGQWAAEDSPVLITANAMIPSGATLQIEPGVRVRLAPGVSLTVLGSLRATGAPGRRVRFEPAASDTFWDSIAIRPGAEATLQNCIVRGGGRPRPGSLSAAIRVEGGHLSLVGCDVVRSAGNGVLLLAGSASVASSHFDANGGAQPSDAGIHVVSGTFSLGVGERASSFTNSVFGLYNHDLRPVSARGAWWGSATGPQHHSNVLGLGVAVSDDVDYAGYAQAAPPRARGDVDGDGDVTMMDVAAALKIAGGLTAADEDARSRGDLDDDGAVTLVDARLIALAVAEAGH